MSKELILYRHGKSDWHADYNDDHERPLAERGRKSSATMGRLLASSGQLPELVVVSSALRARQTLEVSMEEGSWDCEVIIEDSIYYGGPQELIDLVKSLPDHTSRVMLVGHEPKWSNLTATFIGGGVHVFPTAAMARIDFECEQWSKIVPGSGALRWLLQPSFFIKGNFD